MDIRAMVKVTALGGSLIKFGAKVDRDRTKGVVFSKINTTLPRPMRTPGSKMKQRSSLMRWGSLVSRTALAELGRLGLVKTAIPHIAVLVLRGSKI